MHASARPLVRPALTLLLAGCIVASGCVFVSASTDDDHGTRGSAGAHEGTSEGTGNVARAVVEAKSGSELTGKATFSELEGGVIVKLTVENAAPGWHAVHIHETGDCSAADGTSAGGHFNPAGVDHGSPHAAVHHAGDLGNMEVRADGTGLHVIFMPGLTVSPGDTSVVGRAIVVHADADDLVSQPTGAAGGRIGCGVIH